MWNWLGIGQSSASAEAKDQVQEDSKEPQQGDDTDLDKKVREPGDTEKDGSKDGEKDSSRQPTDQDDVHLNKVAKDVAKNVGS